MTEVGTPLFQFAATNQLPVLSIQFVSARHSAASATVGEAQSAKPASASRIAFLVSIRGACGVDLVFMSDEEVLILTKV